MQEVDHPESSRDQGEYGMLSPRQTDLRRGPSMWEDALKSHFTQSEFRIIRVSTEVFQTMQSLPSEDDSVGVTMEFQSREITPKTSQCFAQVCLLALCAARSASINPSEVYTPSEREPNVSG